MIIKSNRSDDFAVIAIAGEAGGPQKKKKNKKSNTAEYRPYRLSVSRMIESDVPVVRVPQLSGPSSVRVQPVVYVRSVC